jgi:L-aminopeptidase/D-esterase-like protein
MDISNALDKPVGTGNLTVDTDAQAKARARQSGQDKGGGAGRAALTLVRLKRKLGKAKQIVSSRARIARRTGVAPHGSRRCRRSTRWTSRRRR